MVDLLSDYKDSNNFNWEQYLIETKSTAVSPDCFKEREPHEFKYGMKVEVVDKRNPVLIRVATIVDTQPHAVKINFDGWDAAYDYWMDDDNPDLHPPLWCQNARYPLQPRKIIYYCFLGWFPGNLKFVGSGILNSITV